jgi:hypothetical protein
MSRRFPKGKAVQDEPVMQVVAYVLWFLMLVVGLLFILWTWSPWQSLFLPGFSWLP